mgnify:CR=1 FL=1
MNSWKDDFSPLFFFLAKMATQDWTPPGVPKSQTVLGRYLGGTLGGTLGVNCKSLGADLPAEAKAWAAAVTFIYFGVAMLAVRWLDQLGSGSAPLPADRSEPGEQPWLAEAATAADLA